MVAQLDFPRRSAAASRRSLRRHPVRRRGSAWKIPDYILGSYIDEVLCMVKANGDRFFYSVNDLYSVYALTDSNGTVVERYMYSPYGGAVVLAPDGVTVRTASLYGNPWTFTGRRLDGETGLMYFRNRMYEVGLGRFISRDPWHSDKERPKARDGYPDGFSTYAAYFIPMKLDSMGLAVALCTCAPCGTFSLSPTNVSVPTSQLLAAGGRSAMPGFDLDYTHTAGCTTTCQRTWLVQALVGTLDFTTEQETAQGLTRGTPPAGSTLPSMGPRGKSPISYIDSPNDPSVTTPGGRTWSLEACAICQLPGCCYCLLGCVTFTWNDAAKTFTVPGSLPTPGVRGGVSIAAALPTAQWTNAEKDWDSRKGQGLWSFCAVGKHPF